MIGCAALCLARGVLGDSPRVAWLFLEIGLSCDAAGEILSPIGESFAPTAQNALYLCLYLGAYIAIVLLGRRHVRHFHLSMWLDGLIGALAIAALGTAALSTSGFLTPHGGGVRTALQVSYPLADVLLAGVVVTMLTLGGWRVYRPFLVIALGFLLMAAADAVYLFQEAHATYAVGTPLDSLWLLSAAILAYAAWQPYRESVHERHSLGAIMAAPISCGLIAIGVLAYGSVEGIAEASSWLAGTLVAVLARLLATASENLRLIAASSELANRDALTGLRNRRALLGDARARGGERDGVQAEADADLRSQRVQALQRHLRTPRRRRPAGAPRERGSPSAPESTGAPIDSAGTSSARSLELGRPPRARCAAEA